jgi:hypothetical protein
MHLQQESQQQHIIPKQHEPDVSAGIEPLQERQGLPAQLLDPSCSELNVHDPAALLHSSARVLLEMQADDLQTQVQHLQLWKLARQTQQLHYRHQAHHQQQLCPQAMQDAALAAYRNICSFDARTAAANNLSIRCHGSTAGSPRGSSSHSAHTPMHGSASSSAVNNVGGFALSPVSMRMRAREFTAAPTAGTGLLPLPQHPQHSTATGY